MLPRGSLTTHYSLILTGNILFFRILASFFVKEDRKDVLGTNSWVNSQTRVSK